MDTVPDLRKKAAELRKVADMMDETANALENLGYVRNENNGHPNHLFLGIPKDLSRLSAREAIEKILQTRQDGLVKDDLLRALRERGKAVSPATLAVYLSRNKDLFEKRGGGRWGLVQK